MAPEQVHAKKAVKSRAKVAMLGAGTAATAAVAAPVPQEKRLKRFKSHPTIEVAERIHRALSQRLYLISQEDISSEVGGLGRKFAVLGTTGNVYDVQINKLPSCTCPDCARGKLCKHIIFVLARVLHVPQNSQLIYQSALLQSELKQIFDAAPRPPAVVLARAEVITAYAKRTGGGEVVEAVSQTAVVNDKAIEGECPVCFENLATKEQLDSCATCRNYIHRDCLTQWLKVQRNCCYCRSDWCSLGSTPGASSGSSSGRAGGAPVGAEGYVNLASQQGLSRQRDTSTYHMNSWRRGYYGRGFW